MLFERASIRDEQDEEGRVTIERMLTEDRASAERALLAVGATVTKDVHGNTCVDATAEQLRMAQEWVPEEVYHGSANADIDMLVPHGDVARNEPESVYASPSPEIALLSTLNRQSGVGGGIVKGTRFVYITTPRGEYISSLRPACVYTLPGSAFRTNGSIGLGRLELVSREPIAPKGKTIVDDPLQSVIDAGVRVYFVTAQQAETIKDLQNGSADNLETFLDNLPSENQARETR